MSFTVAAVAGIVGAGVTGVTGTVKMIDGAVQKHKAKKEAEEAADIMCKAVKLEIPSKVDIDTGQSWGDSL